jgi:hypothetical protein
MRTKSKCGTRSAYTAGCRCEACKQANNVYQAAWRLATGRTQRFQRDIQPRHGSRTLWYRGCRCGSCVEWRAEDTRKHREYQQRRAS